MRKILTLAAALAVAATVTSSALSADPVTPVPFPASTVGPIFVAAHTLTTSGSASNYFAPGATVVFHAYAVDGKTKKLLVAKDVKYFYVTIPNQPNLKLKYDAKQGWTGSWVVPSTYPAGAVAFKVLVKSQAKRHGMFVQMPVTAAQLTIAATPPAYPSGAPAAPVAALPAKQDVSLYVDTVNGTRPLGAAPRAAGCSQTNVFKRGEQLVVRAWGADLAKGDVLSSDNVDSAVVSIAGQPDLTLSWGGHGSATSKVWFWSAPWNIPTTFPLGDVTLKVTVKTDAGKVGTFDVPITIIP